MRNKNKTRLIIDHFERNPNRDFSPDDVAKALGLEHRLVASVLGRLVSQGTITKSARGMYKLKAGTDYDEKAIIEEMRTLLGNTFGPVILKNFDSCKDLRAFLERLKGAFGDRLANNLIREAVLKRHKGEKAEAIINVLELEG